MNSRRFISRPTFIAFNPRHFSVEVQAMSAAGQRRPDGPEIRLPLYHSKRTPVGRRGMSERCRYCCKSRKSKDDENLANVDFLPTPPLQYSVAPIRSSVIVFARSDVVPHIAARETHQRS